MTIGSCQKCGAAGMRFITHICPDPGVTFSTPQTLDASHWLYKAGYEQGRQDALKERDLSPLGRSSQ